MFTQKPYDTFNALDPLTGEWVNWTNPRLGTLRVYWWAVEHADYWDLTFRVPTFLQRLSNWDQNYANHPSMYKLEDRPKPPNATRVELLPGYVIETRGDPDVYPDKPLKPNEIQPLVKVPPPPSGASTATPPSGGFFGGRQ